MSRFKYRIWDKENSKWFEPTYRAYEGHVEELAMLPSGDLVMRTLNHQYENVNTHQSMFPDRFDIVWSTGLKDRNGKEIYEGDILQHISAEKGRQLGVVKFELGGFVSSVAGQGSFGMKLQYEWVEVIGNTYENPELIESTGIGNRPSRREGLIHER